MGPASHIYCTLVHVYSNVITFSHRHERRQSQWKCQSRWMHQEDIKPVWILYVTREHWMAHFQTLSLAIKSTMALLKMSPLMKSKSQRHETPAFCIQIMDTRRCVLILRAVQDPQRCLRILSCSLEATWTSHHRCPGTRLPKLDDHNRPLNVVAFYVPLHFFAKFRSTTGG